MWKNRSSRFFILLTLGILIIIIGSFTAIQVNAQERSANDIYDRLKHEGVPVLKVITINRIPYEIEIHLQSTSENNRFTLDDHWFMQLAHREATLAYRIGLPLTSYRLNVYNIKGELISSTDTYLYPEDLSQKSQPGKSIVDNQTTKKIITEKIQLADLSLDELDVTQVGTPGDSGQVLLIQVAGKDLQDVNRSLPKFLGSMLQLMDTINSQVGANIVLCHIRVVDETGTVLLDYVRDLEGGSAQWTAAEGLDNDWFEIPRLAPTATIDLALNKTGYPMPAMPTAPPASTVYP